MLTRNIGGGTSYEERRVVILDLGASLTKVGFSGDESPRHIIRSEVKDRISGESLKLSRILTEKRVEQKDVERYLCDMLHYIYYKLLLMNPQDRRLCIVEGPFQHMVFRNALNEILFNHFKVNLVAFIPSPCACALAIVRPTALVIDVGWHKSVITPVVQGVAMMLESEVLLAGAKTIQDKLEETLIENSMLLLPDNTLVKVSEKPLVLTPEIVEDIVVRTCFTSPLSRAEEYSKSEKGQFKFAPSLEFPLQASEILQVTGLSREFSMEAFFSFNNEETNIGDLVVKAVYNCPIDVRKELLNNIVLVGGTCHLPGFCHRLMSEIDHNLKHGSMVEKCANNQSIAIHKQPCKAVSTSWLGASIASNSESPKLKYISIKEFKLNPSIADDWNVFHKAEI